MAQAFNMPKIGMTMEEGTVVRWRIGVGEEVKKGDVLLEVETDKAVMDVESDLEGTLLKVVAPEGETLPCGELLAWIGAPGEAV